MAGGSSVEILVDPQAVYWDMAADEEETPLDKNGEPVIEDGKAVFNPIVAEEDSNGSIRNGLAFRVVGEYTTDSEKPRVLIQSTGSVHNLIGGDNINLYYFAENGVYSSAGTFYGVTNVTVKGIGDRGGDLMPYYFSIDSAKTVSASHLVK